MAAVLCLRRNAVKDPRRRRDIAKLELRQRDAALHVNRGDLRRRQRRQLSARRGVIALCDVDFYPPQHGIDITRFPRQNGVISGAGRRIIATLLRPVRQR